MKRQYKKSIAYISLLVTTIVQYGCKKLVEPSVPNDKIAVSAVYASNNTAASVLTRLFSDMQSIAQGTQGMPMLGATSADDLKMVVSPDAFTASVYANNMTTSPLWWGSCYGYIYVANDAIEQVTLSKGITDPVKKQLIGEAKFARAFNYFYLLNFYGDVPLALTTDYKVNMMLTRTPAADVYKQIINDLTDARDLLSSTYLNFNIISPSPDHVRPTRAAAAALLARAYLYAGDYSHAETAATEVIDNPVYGLTTLDSVFLKNSREAIWQLPALITGYNDMDANTFILTAAPDLYHPFVISVDLDNAFETGDLRSSKWVGTFSGYRFPRKYKAGTYLDPVTEYVMMLRLGEQYLIRAEARIKQDRTAEGIADLNTIRARARGTAPGDLPDLSTTMNKADALLAVEHERRVELFTEWGHRWFDLRRTGRIDAVMSAAAPVKYSTWNPQHALFPIPPTEILTAPGLTGHQNPGY